MALASRLSRHLPRIVAGGAAEIAKWLAEIAGVNTTCVVYAVHWGKSTLEDLELLASYPNAPGIAVSVPRIPLTTKRISIKAALLNKMIYVDDFDDPDWRGRYVRPSPSATSELALPIPVERALGKRVEYVVSLYRPDADSFSYEEIGLFRGSTAHIQTVLGKADDAVDAVCHDARNIANAVNDQYNTLYGISEGITSTDPKDICALSVIMAWSASNCELIAASLCGFPRKASMGHPEPISAIVDCIKRAENLLMPYGITINVSVPENLSTCSQAVCGQILWNLVHNAGKVADNSHPEVSIIGRMVHGELQLVVEDNGPGFGSMTRDQIEELLLPRRAAGSRMGQGFGLFLAKTCAQAVGGSISARNRNGRKGAHFEVRLPV